MFIPRCFAAVLLLTATLIPLPPHASAQDEEVKKKSPAKTQQDGDSKKTSPTPTPRPSKKSPVKASPSAKKSPAPSPSPAAKKSSSPSPTPTPSSKKKAKKSKAKPKPAVKKKHPQTEAETPKRQSEPEPEKKPTPEPTPRPTATPETPPRPAPHVPHAAVTPAPSSDSVVVSKSGMEEEEPDPTPEPEQTRWWWPFGHSTHHYKYLTRSIREAIDDAPVPRHQWRYIVVHNSGTRQGNAKAFDYYHRYVRKMPNGLAYHFVIGNGTSSGNGAIEIGSRWTRQINGGHVHSDYLNSIALGICLVGDYNHEKPTREQLEALDELIQYLRHRVGKTDHKLAIVKPHRDINPPQWPTDCPGDRFPYDWLNSHFGE